MTTHEEPRPDEELEAWQSAWTEGEIGPDAEGRKRILRAVRRRSLYYALTIGAEFLLLVVSFSYLGIALVVVANPWSRGLLWGLLGATACVTVFGLLNLRGTYRAASESLAAHVALLRLRIERRLYGVKMAWRFLAVEMVLLSAFATARALVQNAAGEPWKEGVLLIVSLLVGLTVFIGAFLAFVARLERRELEEVARMETLLGPGP